MAEAHLLTLSHKDPMSSWGPKKGSSGAWVSDLCSGLGELTDWVWVSNISMILLKFDKTLLIYFLY
jgi:hypothetical protein